MSLSKRKDEKIQIYKTEKKKVNNAEKSYRRFIYSQAKKESGGLWANARSLMDSEKANNDLAFENSYVEFTVNRNPKIDSSCIIIYKNETYAIESTDKLDFRAIDMKIKAKLIVDKNKYAGDLYNEPTV